MTSSTPEGNRFESYLDQLKYEALQEVIRPVLGMFRNKLAGTRQEFSPGSPSEIIGRYLGGGIVRDTMEGEATTEDMARVYEQLDTIRGLVPVSPHATENERLASHIIKTGNKDFSLTMKVSLDSFGREKSSNGPLFSAELETVIFEDENLRYTSYVLVGYDASKRIILSVQFDSPNILKRNTERNEFSVSETDDVGLLLNGLWMAYLDIIKLLNLVKSLLSKKQKLSLLCWGLGISVF